MANTEERREIENHQEIEQIIKQINKTKIDNEKKHKFVTESSRHVSKKLILLADETINRCNHVLQINELIKDFVVSNEIEDGIFEFALIHVTINNFHENLLLSVYKSKFNEIILNLDKNSRLKNKTLRPMIKNNTFKPQLIAFLSPQQLHPKKWAAILKKKEFIIDKEKNIGATDVYTCQDCGESKCTISQLQTRGADEPTTTFITCCVCFTTVTQEDNVYNTECKLQA
jgi:DNA-directed RNA polymerase subunit M/transcription elongation factor TFIIS